MCCIVSTSCSARGNSVNDVSTKPCCSAAAALCRRVWLRCVLSPRGFSFVTHMFSHTDGHWWSIQSAPPHTPPANSRHILHTYCYLLFSPLSAASPVKPHHWHSDHSTCFNSFHVTSSLLSNKQTKPMLTWLLSAGWMPSRRACHIDWNICPVSHRWTSCRSTDDSVNWVMLVAPCRWCQTWQTTWKSLQKVFALSSQKGVFYLTFVG